MNHAITEILHFVQNDNEEILSFAPAFPPVRAIKQNRFVIRIINPPISP